VKRFGFFGLAESVFSTYAAEFWSERLRWFELQAAAGLVGEIDYEKTKDGVVVCKDGSVPARSVQRPFACSRIGFPWIDHYNR